MKHNKALKEEHIECQEEGLRAQDPGRGLGRKLSSQRDRSCGILSVLKVTERSDFKNILQSGKAVLNIQNLPFSLFTYL